MAAPTRLRSLSHNFSEAADVPPHRWPWAHIARKHVLARESHGACFLPQQLLLRESERPDNPSPGGGTTNFFELYCRIRRVPSTLRTWRAGKSSKAGAMRDQVGTNSDDSLLL